MRTAVFSTKGYDRQFLEPAAAERGQELRFHEVGLSPGTATLAEGCEAVCVFVNDRLDAEALERLHGLGVRLVALRCAGFNNVDLAAAARLGVAVARVPAYSPAAVAEHAVALLLALNRKIHRAVSRTREHNFALGGLLGFDLEGKAVGIVGTGQIGAHFARIMLGFGCRVLASDPSPSDDLAAAGVEYAELELLLRESHVLSLHCPLTPQTHHLIDDAAVGSMREGVYLINTSRGAVVDTRAVIRGLKRGRIGGLGIDVYEEEGDLFFRDLSEEVLQDDVLARLLTFPNVVVTAHQGFFTVEAMTAIARITMENVATFEREGAPPAANVVEAEVHVAG